MLGAGSAMSDEGTPARPGRRGVGLSVAAMVVSLGSAVSAAYNNTRAQQWAAWTACVRGGEHRCPAGWAISRDVERIPERHSRLHRDAEAAASEAVRRDRLQEEAVLTAFGASRDAGCAVSPRAMAALDAVAGPMPVTGQRPGFLKTEVVALRPGHWTDSVGAAGWTTTVALKVEVDERPPRPGPDGPRFHTTVLDLTGGLVAGVNGCPAIWRLSDVTVTPTERSFR